MKEDKDNVARLLCAQRLAASLNSTPSFILHPSSFRFMFFPQGLVVQGERRENEAERGGGQGVNPERPRTKRRVSENDGSAGTWGIARGANVLQSLQAGGRALDLPE
jgi:hypothetical protein